PAEHGHPFRIFRLDAKLPSIVTAQGGCQIAAAAELLVGKADHLRIRPGLRPDLDEPPEQVLRFLIRVRLRHQGQHGGRGARYAHVAMSEEVALRILFLPGEEIAAESEHSRDVIGVWHHPVGYRGYDVVEAQRRAMMLRIARKSFKLRQI